MKLLRALLPVLLVTAGWMAYRNSLQAPFIFDDFAAIVENPNIRHLHSLRTTLSTSPAFPDILNHRLVVALSLAVNYSLGGMEVRGYHLFNLFVHLAAGLVLYGLIRRTLLTPALRGRYESTAPGIAWAAALLWIVHPLQTQTVTCVIRRSEGLMALFYFLTLYGVLRHATASRGSGWGILSVLFCCLGMATKQVMLTAPIAALLYDRTYLGGSFRKIFSSRWKLYAGLAASWGVLGFLVAVNPPIKSAGFSFPELSFTRNLLTQPGVLLHYLRLAVWPYPLVLDYNWPAARTLSEAGAAPWVLLGLLALGIWVLRRAPRVGFPAFFAFLVLVPSSLIPMPSEIAAEHRMYLPLAGLATLAATGGHHLLRRRTAWATGILGVTALLFGTLTVLRNEEYTDPLRLWAQTAAVQPRNSRVLNNLGAELMRAGRLKEAGAVLRHSAAAAPPDDDFPYVNQALIFVMIGHPEEAISLCREALRRKPDSAGGYYVLAKAYHLQGRLEEALAAADESLHLNTYSARTHTLRGVILQKLGRNQEALEEYREALWFGSDTTPLSTD